MLGVLELCGTVCPAEPLTGQHDVPLSTQVLKDRVDGELGPQTCDEYAPSFLLEPRASFLCETGPCCRVCGRCGEKGPCGPKNDPEEGRR